MAAERSTPQQRRIRALDARARAVQRASEAQIEALARAAFARFWKALLADPAADVAQAIRAAQVEFGGDFAERLARAFSELLQRSVGTADVRAMPVGEITLSSHLWRHARQVQGEVTAIVRSHAAGIQQARDLALRLYDGYNPGDGIRRPLHGAARTHLPRALRALTTDYEAREELARLVDRGQREAARLKSQALRAAYTEAFDTWKEGAAKGALQRRLDIAVREKNRTYAQRIALTELARAHQDEVAAEMLADSTIEVVQVRLNPRHPLPDICDLRATADLYGLGPGCYPKAKAPKPPFHPYCWCRLSSRPDLSLRDASFSADPAARAREFLRRLPPAEAARVLGSRDRLQRALNGADPVAVFDEGVSVRYRTRRVGDAALDNGPMPSAYETAKAGGKHHGLLDQLAAMGYRQRQKSVRSYQEQVDLHLDKIAHPEKHVPGWAGLRASHQASILREWRKEVLDHQQQIEIIKGYEDEHQ